MLWNRNSNRNSGIPEGTFVDGFVGTQIAMKLLYQCTVLSLQYKVLCEKKGNIEIEGQKVRRRERKSWFCQSERNRGEDRERGKKRWVKRQKESQIERLRLPGIQSSM